MITFCSGRRRTVAMTAEPGQWIEELFPPAFGLTINDILKSKPPGSREENKDTINVFEKVAKCQISPLDVSAIKNVYQRVWLVTVLQEEEGRIKVKGNLSQLTTVLQRR